MSKSVLSIALLGVLLSSSAESFFLSGPKVASIGPKKDALLQELENPAAFNAASNKRTQLVADLTTENPTARPGSTKAFSPFAGGTWRIVYAPHISTMGGLFRGSFDPVLYEMKENGEMTSHAKYRFPLIGSGWLSVSGTYSSEDEENVCRVDFDKAWIKLNTGASNDEQDADQPYPSLEDVPASIGKSVVQALGAFFFIDAVSVFPVSYLDEDTIVFDFELLGTRICARKIAPIE